MVTAFILATTKTGKEVEVLEELKNLKEIKELYNIYGDYDLLIRAETEDLDKLNEFLVNKVRNLSNVAVTTTMIGL